MSAVMPRQPGNDPQVEALKIPPHSIESEQSTLGGLLLDNHAWDKIGDLLREDDFYRGDHRLVWKHISKLIERGKPADVITVFDSLDADKWPAGHNLKDLYIFLLFELVNANVEKNAARVVSCQELVAPLCEAWSEAAGIVPSPAAGRK